VVRRDRKRTLTFVRRACFALPEKEGRATISSVIGSKKVNQMGKNRKRGGEISAGDWGLSSREGKNSYEN